MVQLLKIIVFDGPGTIFVEETERDLILGVWFGNEVLKRGPVLNADSSEVSTIGNVKENSILITTDFMLHAQQ